ncbi:hypothetical protein Tco_0475459 [Tanacetum coccineum]
MDDEDAPGLKAVPNFQVPDEVEPEDVIDPAEMNTLESRLGSLIQHDTFCYLNLLFVGLNSYLFLICFCNYYEQTYRVGARANDLHMLKTLLYELCKLRGTAIKGHLSMVPIDMEPQPIILAYIVLNLQWGDSMGNNPMPAAHYAGAQLKFVSFLYFKRGVSAKGSKAESIMSVQDKSRPMGSRLVFTPKEPQRERHPMPQPSVIGPTNCFIGSKSRRWKDEFSTRPWKVFWTFWFTDKLFRTGYSGVIQKKK